MLLLLLFLLLCCAACGCYDHTAACDRRTDDRPLHLRGGYDPYEPKRPTRWP